MSDLNALLKKYTQIAAVSGDEYRLRNAIIEDIKDYADNLQVDALGNLLVYKKGKKRAKRRIMLDAHMDEIGLIITNVTSDGYLRFDTVGGIDDKVLFGKRVKIRDTVGVIGGCAVHLLDSSESATVQPKDKLFIDIGAKSREEALTLVDIGETAVFDSEYTELGSKIAARALDDRIGCAVLADMIRHELDYDMYFSFSVQEEVGCRGAKCSAYTIDPDFALVIESTTASDLFGVSDGSKVCVLGDGAAVSFMDNGTLYDREMYKFVLDNCKKNNIKAQLKTAAKGGNDAKSIHLSKSGVRTCAVSLPCRYIHSQYCVADKSDIYSLKNAVLLNANLLASGELQ